MILKSVRVLQAAPTFSFVGPIAAALVQIQADSVAPPAAAAAASVVPEPSALAPGRHRGAGDCAAIASRTVGRLVGISPSMRRCKQVVCLAEACQLACLFASSPGAAHACEKANCRTASQSQTTVRGNPSFSGLRSTYPTRVRISYGVRRYTLYGRAAHTGCSASMSAELAKTQASGVRDRVPNGEPVVAMPANDEVHVIRKNRTRPHGVRLARRRSPRQRAANACLFASSSQNGAKFKQRIAPSERTP